MQTIIVEGLQRPFKPKSGIGLAGQKGVSMPTATASLPERRQIRKFLLTLCNAKER
jgi:hypothetical protein